MKGMAMLSYRGGLTMLPADTPYDLQLLDDQLGSIVRRTGRAQLELNGRQWVVTKAANWEGASSCVTCHLRLRGILYSRRKMTLCPNCARREVGR